MSRHAEPGLRGAARRAASVAEPVALATVDRRARTSAPSCSCGPAASASARSAIPTSTGSSRATRSASSKPGSRRPATTASTAKRAKTTVSVFIESFAPPPRMIIFGAVDFTAALAKVAKLLGYRVIGVRRRARCSRPGSGSRWPTRSSTTGPTATSRRSATTSGHATRCACSRTTPSSTCPRSSARRDRASATSARWGRAARTRQRASSACARPGSPTTQLARVHVADRPRHRRPHAGGDRGRRSAPRSSPPRTGRARHRSLRDTAGPDPLS